MGVERYLQVIVLTLVCCLVVDVLNLSLDDDDNDKGNGLPLGQGRR